MCLMLQHSVTLPKRDRIIPISVLTKSTAESADCCSECEWVFSCEETLGHLVSFTYDLHPFIFNVKSATSRGCLVERDLVATVWKGLSCCWSDAGFFRIKSTWAANCSSSSLCHLLRTKRSGQGDSKRFLCLFFDKQTTVDVRASATQFWI